METRGAPKVDGSIDFSRYTTQQLDELRGIIDPSKFPQDANNISEELRRRANQTSADAAEEGFRVRFTPHEGVRGWFESWASRCPLYGSGSISFSQTGILLFGSQRSWLLAAHPVAISARANDITEVSHAADELDFHISSYGPFHRHFHVVAKTEAEAQQLGAQLSAHPGSLASHSARSVREFNRRLHAEGRRSYFTPALILVNVGVFLAMAISFHHVLAAFDVLELTSWGANLGLLTASGQWWRLISALFLHIGLVHLLLNMWVLWNAGRLSERLYGNISFLSLYFGSGLIASSSSILWNPEVASVGASGAIFGLLAANLAFFLRCKKHVPAAVFRAHWLPTSIFVAFNLVMGILQPGTDNAAHIGGLLGGFGIGWLIASPVGAREKVLRNVSIATGLTGAFLGLMIEFVRGGDFEPSVPQQFFAQHPWYAEGAQKSVRRWQELGARLANGILSSEEFVHDFREDVVPFWQNADARLTAELRTAPANQRSFGELFLRLIGAREKSAQTVLDVVATSDPDAATKIQAASAQTDRADARVTRIVLLANSDHRLRSLSDSYPMRELRFRLGSGGCAQGRSTTDNMVSKSDSPDDGPSMRATLGCAAQRLFLSGDYPTLNSWLQNYGHSMPDLPDGTARFSAIVTGLDDLFEFGTLSVTEALNRSSDWRQSDRTSPYPALIEAMIFQNWAFGVRGHGYANAVSPLAMELFQYRLDMASDSLSESPTASRSTPLFYELSIRLARDQELGLDRTRAAFDQGVVRFPADWPLYSAMLATLMPRWGGSFAMVGRFIVDHSKARGEPDDAMYARLYSMYAALESDRTNIFTDADANWSRMKHGFELLRTQFPKSDYVLNSFARFACVAGDHAAYRWLRQQLSNHPSASAWSEAISVGSCDRRFMH